METGGHSDDRPRIALHYETLPRASPAAGGCLFNLLVVTDVIQAVAAFSYVSAMINPWDGIIAVLIMLVAVPLALVSLSVVSVAADEWRHAHRWSMGVAYVVNTVSLALLLAWHVVRWR